MGDKIKTGSGIFSKIFSVAFLLSKIKYLFYTIIFLNIVNFFSIVSNALKKHRRTTESQEFASKFSQSSQEVVRKVHKVSYKAISTAIHISFLLILGIVSYIFLPLSKILSLISPIVVFLTSIIPETIEPIFSSFFNEFWTKVCVFLLLGVFAINIFIAVVFTIFEGSQKSFSHLKSFSSISIKILIIVFFIGLIHSNIFDKNHTPNNSVTQRLDDARQETSSISDSCFVKHLIRFDIEGHLNCEKEKREQEQSQEVDSSIFKLSYEKGNELIFLSEDRTFPYIYEIETSVPITIKNISWKTRSSNIPFYQKDFEERFEGAGVHYLPIEGDIKYYNKENTEENKQSEKGECDKQIENRCKKGKYVDIQDTPTHFKWACQGEKESIFCEKPAEEDIELISVVEYEMEGDFTIPIYIVNCGDEEIIDLIKKTYPQRFQSSGDEKFLGEYCKRLKEDDLSQILPVDLTVLSSKSPVDLTLSRRHQILYDETKSTFQAVLKKKSSRDVGNLKKVLKINEENSNHISIKDAIPIQIEVNIENSNNNHPIIKHQERISILSEIEKIISQRITIAQTTNTEGGVTEEEFREELEESQSKEEESQNENRDQEDPQNTDEQQHLLPEIEEEELQEAV